MKVRATQRGYYGNVLRDPGSPDDTFVLTDPKHFSETWMEKVKGEKSPAKSGRGKNVEDNHGQGRIQAGLTEKPEGEAGKADDKADKSEGE